MSHGGFNTLASYQMAMMFGDKKVKCGDQNNPDLYKQSMLGKALCLPQTIGSTTGGMVLYTVCSRHLQPACMLFSMPIDSLAASGAILADVWTDAKMPVVDPVTFASWGMFVIRGLESPTGTRRLTPPSPERGRVERLPIPKLAAPQEVLLIVVESVYFESKQKPS